MPSNTTKASESHDSIRFRPPPGTEFEGPVIKVLGVGGGGGNAVRHMVSRGLTGVEFVVANTDAQALSLIPGSIQKIRLGHTTTKGLGAGAIPELGTQAAKESEDEILESLQGANLVFVAAGMGGGTGTGATPVICQLARDRRILTVAVVTKPFSFEQGQRRAIADQGVEELRNHVDSLIVIPNDKLLSEMGEDNLLFDAFRAADEVLCGAVQGIADLVNHVGHINLDFADVKTVMSEPGMAVIGSCSASGDERAKHATEGALRSPLLEEIDLGSSKAALINVSCNPQTLKSSEYKDVGEVAREYLTEGVRPMIGLVAQESLGDAMRVTVVVTGITPFGAEQPESKEVKEPELRFSSARPKPVGGDDPVETPNVPRTSQATKNSRLVRDSDYVDVPSFLRHQVE